MGKAEYHEALTIDVNECIRCRDSRCVYDANYRLISIRELAHTVLQYFCADLNPIEINNWLNSLAKGQQFGISDPSYGLNEP